MRYSDTRLYVRSLRGIGDQKRLKAIHEAVSQLLECFEKGARPPIGLGLKKLEPPVWEIRSSLHDRILFGWSRDVVTFLVVGNHTDIKRFLKRA